MRDALKLKLSKNILVRFLQQHKNTAQNCQKIIGELRNAISYRNNWQRLLFANDYSDFYTVCAS